MKTEIDHIHGVEVIKVASLGRFLSAPIAPGFPAKLKKLNADILS